MLELINILHKIFKLLIARCFDLIDKVNSVIFFFNTLSDILKYHRGVINYYSLCASSYLGFS
jgi:hypothetical protein